MMVHVFMVVVPILMHSIIMKRLPVDDGSCIEKVYGCTDDYTYIEYLAEANTDDGSCQTLIIEGCTDSNFIEYYIYNGTDFSITAPDPVANTDDGRV